MHTSRCVLATTCPPVLRRTIPQLAPLGSPRASAASDVVSRTTNAAPSKFRALFFVPAFHPQPAARSPPRVTNALSSIDEQLRRVAVRPPRRASLAFVTQSHLSLSPQQSCDSTVPLPEEIFESTCRGHAPAMERCPPRDATNEGTAAFARAWSIAAHPDRPSPFAPRSYLNSGGDAGARTERAGMTLLMGACLSGQEELVATLLRWAQPGDVDVQARHHLVAATMQGPQLMAGRPAQAQEGGTALMAAACCEDDGAIARLLLTAGADTALRDASGRSALDWAREEGLASVASLVRTGYQHTLCFRSMHSLCDSFSADRGLRGERRAACRGQPAQARRRAQVRRRRATHEPARAPPCLQVRVLTCVLSMQAAGWATPAAASPRDSLARTSLCTRSSRPRRPPSQRRPLPSRRRAWQRRSVHPGAAVRWARQPA